jgi:nicotinamide-nucleotide amidase
MDDVTRAIAATLLARGQWLATAESCTGGMVAKLLTDVAGSSAWFERGVVVYSNAAKRELLGVPDDLLDRHGAVSGEVARAMAQGVIGQAPVDWSIAITGIAGPGGGSADKPVGTVWIGWGRREGSVEARRFHFSGDRESIRVQSADAALQGLLERLKA